MNVTLKFTLLLFLMLFTFSSPMAMEQSLPKSIQVNNAGVASAHIEASQVGVRILKDGGNAADAATAVAMALAVVFPQAGNLGGGGFLVYRHSGNQIYVLDFRETASSAATENMYLDDQGNVQEKKSLVGGLAVGVPGTVRGFYQFHQKYGQLSWNDVLQPAIQLAKDGFVINEYLENSFKNKARSLKQFPSTRSVFFPKGEVPKAGDLFQQIQLARSLKSIANHGPDAFYEGEIAKEIVKSVRNNGGIISLQDLKAYQPVERDPIQINYRGYNIFAAPPPSSGGAVIGGILNALKQINLEEYPLHSAQQIALLIELEKRYFAFRNQLLGDPAFVEMPLEKLLSPKLANHLFKEIDLQNPLPSQEISAEKLLRKESEETTHFSVIDSHQNAVSVTYTLNASFGSKLVAGNTGILLNNEMDDFASKPGSPNMYGLVQGAANSIHPGKRMLSSMTPLIVTKNGELIGLLGSPGGPTIITTVLQVLINMIDYEIPLSKAIDTGRFHHQWLPDTTYYERDKFNPDVLKTLEQWGYAFVERNSMGDVHAVWKIDDEWLICSDMRGNGYPGGF